MDTTSSVEEVIQSLIALVIAGVAFSFLVFAIVDLTKVSEYEDCAVIDKYTRTNDRTNIIDTTCGTFEVVNSVIDQDSEGRNRFELLEIGNVYDFTTRGYALGTFQIFPNVIEVKQP